MRPAMATRLKEAAALGLRQTKTGAQSDAARRWEDGGFQNDGVIKRVLLDWLEEGLEV